MTNKLPQEIRSKINSAVEKKIAELEKREEFSKLSLKEKGEYLRKQLRAIEQERNSYYFKKAQKEAEQRKAEKDFERFYEEHAKKHGRTL